MSHNEINSWKDVEFIIESTDAVIEGRYEDAISIMCKELDNKIECKLKIDSNRLMRAFYLLMTAIKKKSEEKLNFQFEDRAKLDNIDSCNFCGKKRSEVAVLFGSANALICDLCIENCNELLKNKKNS